MKKISTIIGALLFVLSFGIAYAGGLNNGVTDFSGKTYDVLEPAFAQGTVNDIHEGMAAGGVRLVEIDKDQLHNGVTDFSGRTYDVLEITAVPAASNMAEGSAAGGLRQNFAGDKSSVRTYDSVPIGW